MRFLLIFLLALTPVQAALTSTVTSARLGLSDLHNNQARKTRVVLEVNEPVSPKISTLPNPHRVVLDFPHTTFKTDMTDVDLDPRGVVKAMRQGLFKPGVTRMVLDATSAIDAHVFHIPERTLAGQKRPHRIVIDLTRKKSGKSTAKNDHFDWKGATSPTPQPKVTPIQAAPAPVVEQQAPAPVVRKTKPKAKDAPFTIVIDPGHGGVDPGAIGKRKTYEKNVVLEVAQRLKKELEKQPNSKVHMTRYSDKFVKLGERIRYAQRREADLFISLHADAHHVRKVRGASVYVVSEKASDKEAARLAKNANEGDLFAGLDISQEPREVQNILIDLTRRETKNRSVRLGEDVLQELRKVVRVRKKHVLFAGFKVLKAPEIPSILIEMAYLSNPTEENYLRTSKYQTTLAKAIAQGVQDYRRKYESVQP